VTVSERAEAAIITVGTELVTGMRLDTNTQSVARALRVAGFVVREATSVPDHEDDIAEAIARLAARFGLVVVTGGLGPTHDDVTREAAARALCLPLERRADLELALAAAATRHTHSEASRQVLRQADVLRGATVLPAVVGTAPGQVVPTALGRLVLLPGPPAELAPLLASVLEDEGSSSEPVRLRTTGLSESDAQVLVSRALSPFSGVGFTILAALGDVEVLLFDDGAGEPQLVAAGHAARSALGHFCYSTDGSSLAETVIATARARGARIGTAESCTGGMIAAVLTAVPGSSVVVMGGVVAYANHVKSAALGVPEAVLREHGAVSPETARAMAAGVAERLDLTHAVSVTGIAGPAGGTPEKPVGLVHFGVYSEGVLTADHRHFTGTRDIVRVRATAVALDLLRTALETD
jgi:nicotinamide-nucleotide amidase